MSMFCSEGKNKQLQTQLCLPSMASKMCSHWQDAVSPFENENVGKLLVLALYVFVVNCSVAVIRKAESGYVVDFARTRHPYTWVFRTQRWLRVLTSPLQISPRTSFAAVQFLLLPPGSLRRWTSFRGKGWFRNKNPLVYALRRLLTWY